MTADPLRASFDRFGEAVVEYAFSRVREALDLERERHDAEIAELRAKVGALTRGTSEALERHHTRIATLESDRPQLHSVRVEP